MKQSDDSLPSLDDLQHKIDEVKSESEEEQPDVSDGQKMGSAMHLATEFMAAVGVGGVLGYVLDYALGTLPIFFILFFLLGFAAGVRNLLRSYQKVT